jgi:hypothetical protein
VLLFSNTRLVQKGRISELLVCEVGRPHNSPPLSGFPRSFADLPWHWKPSERIGPALHKRGIGRFCQSASACRVVLFLGFHLVVCGARSSFFRHTSNSSVASEQHLLLSNLGTTCTLSRQFSSSSPFSNSWSVRTMSHSIQPYCRPDTAGSQMGLILISCLPLHSNF